MGRGQVQDNSEFMIRQFTSVGQPAVPKGDDVMILCPNPQHDDSNPSFGIDKSGKMGYCFACGWKQSYDQVAEKLGLQKLFGEGGKIDEVKALQSAIAAFEASQTSKDKKLIVPRMLKKWQGGFKKFSPEILHALDTQAWADYRKDGTLVRRIFWPFWQKNQLLGGTGRIIPEDEPKRRKTESPETFKRRLKDFYRDNPKYRNLSGNKAKRVLFPYDSYEDLLPVVLLVEGPTSCIRMLDVGIPAMAILGIRNWSSTKKTLLLGKGCKKVVVAFDGDPAGRSARDDIVADLDELFDVHVLDLPDGQDPYDLSDKWIKWLRKKVYRMGAEFPFDYRDAA